MKKRLYRSRKERVLGGVCAGVAEYLDVDIVLVRLLWVLSALVNGFGIIAYFICWIIIPEGTGAQAPPLSSPGEPGAGAGTEDSPGDGEGDEMAPEEEPGEGPGEGGRRVIGMLLILVGSFVLIGRFGSYGMMILNRLIPGVYWPQVFSMARAMLWPSALILLGLILIVTSRRRGSQ